MNDYPSLDETRYGIRPVRFRDTGENAFIVTIDGKPVALEPSRAALDEYAKRYELEIVTRETMRRLRMDTRDARMFRSLPRWVQRLARL